MRLAEALGIEELIARVKLRWYPWTLTTVVRSVGERMVEWADAADERAKHESPKVVFHIKREWEAKRSAMVAALIGDHIVVAVPGRVVKFKRDGQPSITVH